MSSPPPPSGEHDGTPAELSRRNLELERRVRELDQELESFGYSISHDLRAPLRAIDGFTRLLLDRLGPGLDAEGKADFDRVTAGVRQMTRLIDALLDLSRIARSPLELETMDLSRHAEAVLEQLSRACPGRTVERVVAPGLSVRGDARLLGAALRNLLDNAWKFSGRRPDARIELGARAENGETVYFVKDNGEGFDPAFAGKLFAPFQRLHSKGDFPGTGVGLAAVQRIVRRHGGRVWAEAEPGRGAVFYFTLPGVREIP